MKLRLCYFFSCRLDQGLELDLFLMQCCASVAPPELFVKRVQERFGLSDYTSLNLTKHDEYASTYLDFLKSVFVICSLFLLPTCCLFLNI